MRRLTIVNQPVPGAMRIGFLKRHACGKLYPVGQVIHGWRLKSGLYWLQAHNKVLRRFLALTEQNGVRGRRVPERPVHACVT